MRVEAKSYGSQLSSTHILAWSWLNERNGENNRHNMLNETDLTLVLDASLFHRTAGKRFQIEDGFRCSIAKQCPLKFCRDTPCGTLPRCITNSFHKFYPCHLIVYVVFKLIFGLKFFKPVWYLFSFVSACFNEMRQ